MEKELLPTTRALTSLMIIENALDKWADWGLASRPALLKIFTKGQNHHTALIESNDQKFVLKVFNHSYQRTVLAERWTSTISLSPKIIYASNNVLLLEFISGNDFSIDYLPNIAAKLATLHSRVSPFEHRFDFLKYASDYLVETDDVIHSWHQQLLPVLNEFVQDPTPWAFCHNDLVKENCLFEGDLNVLFIDWEFAQQHNPWFDLAAIILYFDLNEQDAKQFLESYKRGWSEKTAERIFYSSQIALLWIDLLWNVKKSNTQNSDEDYRQIKSHRFEKLMSLATTLNINLSTKA